jgi:nickel transport protein
MRKIFFLISLIIFFLEGSVEAHKVSVYAYRVGDKVFGESYFMDGSPCKKSIIEVFNPKGEKLWEGTTDEKGKFNFNTSERKALRIVLLAGEGHRAEYFLEALERESDKKRTMSERSEVQEKQKKSEFSEASIKRDELRKIIDDVMEAKFQGIKAEIMDLHKKMDKVALRDIIGGVGYIFGIWGLIMFLRRKKNAS